MLAHPHRSPDLAREVLLAQPVLAAVPPRGLRGGLGLALAAGLSLGGSSRALSLCGWPARCLLGVGVDALPALPLPELHGSLAAPAEQQEKLELPSSRSLLRRARSRRAEAILHITHKALPILLTKRQIQQISQWGTIVYVPRATYAS